MRGWVKRRLRGWGVRVGERVCDYGMFDGMVERVG